MEGWRRREVGERGGVEELQKTCGGKKGEMVERWPAMRMRLLHKGEQKVQQVSAERGPRRINHRQGTLSRLPACHQTHPLAGQSLKIVESRHLSHVRRLTTCENVVRLKNRLKVKLRMVMGAVWILLKPILRTKRNPRVVNEVVGECCISD